MDGWHVGGQIDFELYKILHDLDGVLGAYPDEALGGSVEEALGYLQNKKFRVAVVGEFRRGKSSLINALLGMPVLPVDIEPTTATINRVTYGLKPRACIHYKDGRDEAVAIGELANYVTKLTGASARVAATVREAEIFYPTELCGNGVDIIDTPGLNDTESMTLVTDALLQNVQAALVTVKATMPYSDTECDWVARLIGLPRLQYVFFVVTCMDLVPEAERDKVTAYLSERIRTKTLERARFRYAGDEELLRKAERLLSERELRVCPVSAALALDSFDNGDYDALEESRIPALKKELMTALNAQQRLYGLHLVRGILDRSRAWFGSIKLNDLLSGARAEMERLHGARDSVEAYFKARPRLMDDAAEGAAGAAADLGVKLLDEALLRETMKTCFTQRLSMVTVKDELLVAEAAQEAVAQLGGRLLPSVEDRLRKAVNAEIVRYADAFLTERSRLLNQERYSDLLERAGLPENARLKEALIRRMLKGLRPELPVFRLSLPKILTNVNIMPALISPIVDAFVYKYVRAWRGALPGYVREVLGELLREEPSQLEGRAAEVCQQLLGAQKERCLRLRAEHDRAAATLSEACEACAALETSIFA